MAVKCIMIALTFVFLVLVLIMGCASHISPMLRFIVPGILLCCTTLLFTSCYLYSSDLQKNINGKLIDESEQNDLTEILSSLPSDYAVLNDFESLDMSINHIVIGPTGIYVIYVKNLRGGIERKGNVLMLNHKISISNYISNVKKQADNLYAIFKVFGGTKKVIKPVLCFSHAYVNLMSRGEFDGVLVISAKDIVTHITESTQILDSFDVYRAFTFLSTEVDSWCPKLLDNRLNESL